MSTSKQLLIQVRPDGTVHAETLGMTGEECLDYIAVLEDLLDAETTASSYTAAYTEAKAMDAAAIDESQRTTDGA